MSRCKACNRRLIYNPSSVLCSVCERASHDTVEEREYSQSCVDKVVSVPFNYENINPRGYFYDFYDD